jgi:hypothetical protein
MHLTYRMATAEDLASVAAFNRRASGTEIPIEYWRWKYFDNPVGPSGVAIALDGDEIVGLIAALAVPFRMGERRLLASKMEYNAILAAYRGSGVFFGLVTTVYRDLVDKPGVDFCFGIAIKETRDLSVVLLGFEDVAPIGKLVQIINPLPHLRKKWKLPVPRWLGTPFARLKHRRSRGALRGFRASAFEHFGEAHEKTWHEARSERLLVRRDASYLEWRYTACPLQHYEKRQLSSGGSLLGWVVYHTYEERGVRYGILDECFGREESPECLGPLVDLAIAGLLERDVDAIMAFAAPSTALYQALRDHWFVRRPSARCLIVRGLSGRVPESVLASEDQWYYTIGDTEYWLFPEREGWLPPGQVVNIP